MARHYTTRDFFRQIPNLLLARYFHERDLFRNLDFAEMKETKPERLFAEWLEMPDDARNAMDSEFREVFAMSCEKGFRAILDEAEWHLAGKPDELAAFTEKLATLDDHSERAMVTFLDHREFWKGATLFYRADSLSYWRKRKGFPKVEARVHEDGRTALADSIRTYFHRMEGRGNNCVVETFRRGELDYFFAYPEDYSQRSLEWVSGEFEQRRHTPAFEVIYVYSQKEGTLDLNFRGNPKAVEPLQGIFAVSTLGLPELPADPDDASVYDLNPLRTRGFQFLYEPGSGIERVAVRRMRLSSRIRHGDRIILEADTSKRDEALYDLLEDAGKSVPVNLYNVTQVEIAATVKMAIDKPAKQYTFRITYPNSCSLKYDDVELRLREMLVLSGIEPKEPPKTLRSVEW